MVRWIPSSSVDVKKYGGHPNTDRSYWTVLLFGL